MTPCIRRPSAYWTTCTCPPCRIDKARKAKWARTVGIERVPSDVAWATMDDLLRRGWTGLAIATACGVPRRSVEGAITKLNTEGRRCQFGPIIAARIVAHGQPTAGMVGATGARRRLQGLASQGWDLRRLTAVCGIGESTLAAIRTGYTERVSVAMHNTILTTVADIGLTVGESKQSRENADRKGWVGLFAWEDIDDPSEKPHVGARGMVFDEVIVERLLAGERLKSNRAEKEEAMRRWLANGGSQRELCRMHGWGENRYAPKKVAA